MTNLEIVEQIYLKTNDIIAHMNAVQELAAQVDALSGMIQPEAEPGGTTTPAQPSSGTWLPATPEHAASLGWEDLLDLANMKQTMTHISFTPASYFETTDEFVQHLIGYVTT